MTVEGSGQIIRNLSPSSGGAITFVDDLYWNLSGASDSYPFTITVAEEETLLISPWWQLALNTDHDINVMIDGVRIDPLLEALNATFNYRWPATFWTRAVLSAGDHSIGLVAEFGSMDDQGGVIVFHIPNSKIGTQHNTV